MLVVFAKKTVKADRKFAVKGNKNSHKAVCCDYINDHLSLVSHLCCLSTHHLHQYISRTHFLEMSPRELTEEKAVTFT